MDYALDLIGTIGHMMTGVGTIILSILIYRTFKHLNASTRAAEIQTEYKFRPWIGHTGVIKEISSDSNKKQFEIMIKNYGDLPATEVIVSSLVKDHKITKDEIKTHAINHISLGPILPNMEKRYWLDVKNSIIETAKNENGQIFTAILLEYPLSFGKSEYGLISEINTSSFAFTHIDMWAFSPQLKNSKL